MIYLINTYRYLSKLFTDANSILLYCFKLAAAGFILYFIVSYVSVSSLADSLAGADHTLIASAFALSFLNLYLQFLKWKIIADKIVGEKNGKKVFISLLCGFSAGIATPLRLGEYAGRALFLGNKKMKDILTGIFIDKLFPLLMVIFFGGISSLLYLAKFHQDDFSLILLGLFSLVIMSAAIVKIKRIRNFFRKSTLRVINKLDTLKRIDKKLIGKTALISFFFYICFIVQFVLLAAAFSGSSNYFDLAWGSNLVMFGKTIIPPVSLGELGIREGASVFFLGEFGVSAAAAVNASLFLFFMNLLLPSLAGTIFFLKKNND